MIWASGGLLMHRPELWPPLPTQLEDPEDWRLPVLTRWSLGICWAARRPTCGTRCSPTWSPSLMSRNQPPWVDGQTRLLGGPRTARPVRPWALAGAGPTERGPNMVGGRHPFYGLQARAKGVYGRTEGKVYMVQLGQDSCRVCGDVIPRERIGRWNWCVTCGRECADANAIEAGRRARRKYRQRRHAQI